MKLNKLRFYFTFITFTWHIKTEHVEQCDIFMYVYIAMLKSG